MPSERAGDRTSVRYEPDDKPPTALTFGLGLQLAILCLSGIVLTPAIVVRAAGGSETYLAWAVFAAVAVSGVTTVLQAVRVGRIGAGYVLLMGTSGAFIAVSVTALAQGGPAMLTTLVVISALFQFVLAARLSLLRRVLTPTVAGTVIMLIAVTVMPIVFDTLKDVLFDQHRGDRAHRGRSAQRRGGHRGDLRGAGVLPKALAVVLAIPGPVAAAYITVLLAMLFVTGMKMVVQDGIDYRKGLVVGVSFWAGVGFQSGVVFPEYFSQVAGGLLQNGMTAGGLVAILMTLFMELTAPRRRRIEVATDLSDLPKIREFLGAFASRNGWDAAMAERLDAAGEETLLSLVGQEEGGEPRERRRLLLVAHKQDGGAVLEFVASSGHENLQDRIALLDPRSAEVPDERETSLRLLRHIASSVRHEQYHGTEIVTVRVDGPQRAR